MYLSLTLSGLQSCYQSHLWALDPHKILHVYIPVISEFKTIFIFDHEWNILQESKFGSLQIHLESIAWDIKLHTGIEHNVG